MSWRSEAACAGRPTEWWFAPPTVNGVPTREHEEAQRICARCPVTKQCKKAGKGEIGTWAGIYRSYKYRGKELVVRCDRCGSLFEGADTTCDSCLSLEELRRRKARNAQRRHREGSPREFEDLVETFERLVELSVW